jgi:lipopolysaccharide/colanic/teichoic acid biosynthesis glycosyltransferase
MSVGTDLGIAKSTEQSASLNLCSHEPIPSLKLSANWSRSFYTSAKRCIDVVGSALLLIPLAPFLLVIAIAVKATSSGPVFYRWRVVGKDGHPFSGHKFRSMVANADQMRSGLDARNEMSGPVFKLKNDPRITPVGRWLRKFSLDELPQLWSVLKGDMSLVGPRPPLVDEYKLFTQQQRLKLSVKPGITCLWQVRGRNEIRDFDEWVRLDLEYIENWSILLDVKILLLTIPSVVLGRGR